MRRCAGLPIVLICGSAAAAAHAAEPPLLSPYTVAPSALAPQDSLAALYNQSSAATDAALVDWRSTQVQLTSKSRLRVSLGDATAAPGLNAVQMTRAAAEPQAYEISLVRDWPSAVAFKTRNFGVNVSPHAAVGM